jgi:hypothetical protein
MRNFHLPLPEKTYEGLRKAAEAANVPATALAREAIDFWLRERVKKARHEAIARFAAEAGGTSLDLDRDLEQASIEHLLSSGKGTK